MYQPRTLVETTWNDATKEMGALYLVTTVAAMQWLSLHWLLAMLLAPVLIAGGLFVLFAGVHLLWMLVVGLDRVGGILGLRKSPFS
jgi:hypothetical protein